MAQEKTFADGFVFKRNDNAPDFVVGKLAIKVEDAVVFLKANAKSGWVNIDVKQSQSGNYYCELDTWTPKNQTKAAEAVDNSTEEEDLPF